MSDPFDDPQARAWADEVRTGLIPKMRESAIVVSLVPDDASYGDIKFAVELGMSIMLDKPIIAVVPPGVQLPDKLVRIADVLVEGPVGADGFQERLQDAIAKVLPS